MQLFVYGGLLKGMTLSPFIEGSEYLGPAFIQADLYFLGQFPGIVKGKGIVFGELYELSESTIPKVDKIEHYHIDDPGHSSYIRKELLVTCLPNKEKTTAEAYFYNRSIKGQELIPHGDYRRFINEYVSQKFWVINSILGGKTNGFFHGLEQGSEPKKALIETINGVKANGLHGHKRTAVKVIELRKEQIISLDKTCKVPDKYSRASIPFIDENGDTQMALTYYPNLRI